MLTTSVSPQRTNLDITKESVERRNKRKYSPQDPDNLNPRNPSRIRPAVATARHPTTDERMAYPRHSSGSWSQTQASS